MLLCEKNSSNYKANTEKQRRGVVRDSELLHLSKEALDEQNADKNNFQDVTRIFWNPLGAGIL